MVFARTLLSCAFAFAAAEVEVLTDANFVETVKSSEKPLFVKFYAPWCGHCKRLAPEWDKLAEAAGDCRVAKVDATVETSVGDMMQIRGYPTLKLFSDNQMWDYQGARSADAMKTWCEGGFKSKAGAKLPMDEGFLDKALRWGGDYLTKISQILAFEPTILPVIFLLGLFLGTFISICLGLGSTEKIIYVPSKKEDDDDDDETVEPIQDKPAEEKKSK